MAVNDRLREAIELIYTHACVDGLNRNRDALTKGDNDTYKNDPSIKLADALRDVYPNVVNELSTAASRRLKTKG